MANDLFLPKINKKQQVFNFIQKRGRCKTSDVICFGLSIFHTRADRDARNLAEEGKIWRVKEMVKMAIAPKSKEEIWSVYEADKEYKK